MSDAQIQINLLGCLDRYGVLCIDLINVWIFLDCSATDELGGGDGAATGKIIVRHVVLAAISELLSYKSVLGMFILHMCEPFTFMKNFNSQPKKWLHSSSCMTSQCYNNSTCNIPRLPLAAS